MNLIYGIETTIIRFFEYWGHLLLGIDDQLDRLIHLLTVAERRTVYMDRNKHIYTSMAEMANLPFGMITAHEQLILTTPSEDDEVMLLDLVCNENYQLVARHREQIETRLATSPSPSPFPGKGKRVRYMGQDREAISPVQGNSGL